LKHLDAARDEESKLKTLLRDARNISMIESETLCDISLHPFLYVQEIATVGSKPKNVKEKKAILEREALARSVEVLKRLSKFRRFEDWLEFLESAEKREFSRAFAPYLTSVQTIEGFADELENQVRLLSWKEAVTPNTWTAMTFFVSLAVSLAGGPLGTIAGIGGLAVSAVGLAPKISTKLNVTEIDEAKKVRWMFMLRGKASVTERGFKRLMRDIRGGR
jgi:hypothetical protein